MWDAQEDVWVTQLILDAIRQMNKDADSTSSAVIRRVIAYRLLGGDGTPVTGGAAAASGDSSGMMSMMPSDMEEHPECRAAAEEEVVEAIPRSKLR